MTLGIRSEDGNAHHKATYLLKRVQAVEPIPILLDVRHYFISDNAESWCSQTRWKIVERLVHGGEADLMKQAFELVN